MLGERDAMKHGGGEALLALSDSELDRVQLGNLLRHVGCPILRVIIHQDHLHLNVPGLSHCNERKKERL